jgi:hypothetical protein
MNYGNFKQKTTNLFIFLNGCMIGCSVLLIANAKEPINQWVTKTSTEQAINRVLVEWKEVNWDTDKLIKSEVREDKPIIRREETGGVQMIESKVWKLPIVLVKGFPRDSMATNIATYAYKVSNWDMDFLMTLKAENWWFDMYKQSNVPDKNWPNGREDSRWICQIHRRRFKHIVDTKEFRESRQFQVEQCWSLYKGWTRFYGRDVRKRFKDDFTIITWN